MSLQPRHFILLIFQLYISSPLLALYMPKPNSFDNKQPKCEKISVPMCRNIEYNSTMMPNQFNHENQQDAALEVHQFWALVEMNCAKELRFFLCSLYTPICLENYPQAIKPCRSVCQRSRIGCERYMKKYGFEWPEHMNCDLFPEYGSQKEVCMDPIDALQQRQTISINNELIKSQESAPTPKTADKPYEIAENKQTKFKINEPILNSCAHPLVKLTEKDQRFNKISTGSLVNCAQPCQSVYLSDSERSFAFYWILSLAILCAASSLFTATTFLIERYRFKYPEKPIIYLSICYLFVSLGYLMKYLIGHEKMVCESDGSLKYTIAKAFNSSGSSCTLVFILTYYFSMASSAWWVIISLTWFLAAGLKWSIESIAKYNYYFHLTAWLLPAIKTVLVMSLGLIDADSISGICSVGNSDAKSLQLFVIAPMLAYLIIGMTFLLMGFVALFRIRNLIKQQQGHGRTHKLEKLMLRIGVFSILYTVPATCVIASYFYELYFRFDWEQSFICKQNPRSELCAIFEERAKANADGYLAYFASVNMDKEPLFALFMLRYFMSMIVGVLAGFWIWTNKTVVSWREFLKALFCFAKGGSKDSIVYFQANTCENVPPKNIYNYDNQQIGSDHEANYCNFLPPNQNTNTKFQFTNKTAAFHYDFASGKPERYFGNSKYSIPSSASRQL